MKKSMVFKYTLCAIVLTALLVAVFAFSLVEVNSNGNFSLSANDAVSQTRMFLLGDDGSLTAVSAEAAGIEYQSLKKDTKSFSLHNSDSVTKKDLGTVDAEYTAVVQESNSFSLSGTEQINANANERVYVTVKINNWQFGASGNQGSSFDISVSGAVDASGKPAVICDKAQMKKSNNEITVKVYAQSRDTAHATAPLKASATASASVDASGTVEVEFFFEKPVVTNTNQATSYGSITGQGEHKLGTSENVSSTATPKQNCYFRGWTISDVPGTTVSYSPSVTSQLGYQINISKSPEYSADFAEIEGDNWTKFSYEYTGQPQGPRAYDITGYTVSHYYTGKTLNGENYTSSSLPTNAGTYSYTAAVSKDGYTLGTRTISSFTISRTTPTYVFNSCKSEISFGEPLSFLEINVDTPLRRNDDATVAGNWTWESKSLASGEASTVYAPTKLLNSGNHTIFYRFNPDDTNNYNYIDRSVTFVITRSFAVDDIYAMGTNPQSNTCSGVSTAETYINESNQAVIKLTAVPNVAENYFLLGWTRAGEYSTYTDYADNSITYTLTDSSDDQVKTAFQAKFIQFTLVQLEEIGTSYTYTYNGSPASIDVEYSPTTSEHKFFEFSSTAYDGVVTNGVASVGSHKAIITVKNKTTGVIAKTIEIDINVLPTKVQVDDLGSNSAGWSQAPKYTLRTVGATRGSVAYYMYSTDGGANWTKINVEPASSVGCSVTYEPTAPAPNTSKVINYIFRAIHETNGASGTKAVASTDSATVCKIDTFVPTISVAFENGYTGQWINQDITFEINISYGGSGATLQYTTNNGVNWYDTKLVEITPAGQTLSSDNPTAKFDWTRSSEQDYVYKFRIVSGTSVTTSLYESGTTTLKGYSVKIDKSAPVLGTENIDKTANKKGWINQTALATFTATDNNLVSNSGFASIVVDQADATFVLNEGALASFVNTCKLTLPDCRTYHITATDNAGNVTEKDIQYNVDIVTPTFGYDEDSYAEGEWDGEAKFNFAINAGGSGVRIAYSTDGENYSWFDGVGSFYKEEGNETGHNQVVHLTYTIAEEQIQDYWLRAECAAGFVTDIKFGTVKVDCNYPTVDRLNLDDFTAYAWDTGVWTTETLTQRISVADDLGIQKSGIKSVQVNDGASTYDLTYDSQSDTYSFDIVKCTVHTLMVADEAGNVTSYEYRYKVDQGTPSFTYEAKIGATDTVYTFAADSWITPVKYPGNAFVRFKFDMHFSPSGVKLQYSTDNGSTWLEFASDAFKVSDGNGGFTPIELKNGGYIYDPENEFALEQNLVVYLDIESEQDNPFKIMLITGSNKTIVSDNLGQLRLDATAPELSGVMQFVGNESGKSISLADMESKWRYETVTASFSLYDATSLVNSVQVRKYATDATVSFPAGDNVPYEVVALTSEGNNAYHFQMIDSGKYVLVITDNAGNTTFVYSSAGNAHPSYLPKVDTFDGFTVDVTATYTSNGNPYSSGDWIFTSSENVRFDFAYNVSDFGPSGGRIEFSVNNGNSWSESIIVGKSTEQGVVDNGTANPYMIVSATQMTSYLFRVITGAGRYDEFDVEGSTVAITVNKEVVDPNLSVSVTNGSAPYDGSWVNANLTITLDFATGVSGATVMYATSQNPNATFEDGEWTSIKQYGESDANEYKQLISNTTDEYYYFYKFVSGSGRSIIKRTSVIRIDKVMVSATLTAYIGTQTYDSSWTAETIKLKVEDLVVGPSGHTTYYQKATIGTTNWDSLTEAGIENDVLSINYNAESDYIFQIVSGSGIQARTNVVTVRCDVVVPSVDMVIKSGTQLTEGVSDVNMYWWISNVTMGFENRVYGNSGCTEEWSTSQDGGVTWTEWSNNSIGENKEYVIRDSRQSGGTQIMYKFRIVNGAGVASLEKDYKNAVVNGEHQAELIKVDNKTYSVTIDQYVDTIKSTKANGLVFATVEGNNNTNYRGGTFDISIIIADSSKFAFKNLEFSTGASYVQMGEKLVNQWKFSVEIQGESILAVLHMYRLIEINVTNTRQILQNNTITDVDIAITEEDFAERYTDPGFNILYAPKGTNEYSAVVPQEIGEYDVAISTKNENYVIKDAYNKALLQVVYFEGDGVSTRTAYTINNYEDFSYIDYYMNVDEKYDFLGSRRRTGIFRQTADFALPEGYEPIAGIGGQFAGDYNGDNYKITYSGVSQATGNFGLFKYVESGAIINSVILEFGKVVVSGSSLVALTDEEKTIYDGYSIGALASYVGIGATVTACFAIGDIEVTDVSSKVAIGGLIGYAETPTIAYNMTDVSISVSNIAQGTVGGVVGQTNGVIFLGNNVIGNITLVNFTLAGSGKTFGYAGSLVGYAMGDFILDMVDEGIPEEQTQNFYLENNLIIDRVLYGKQGVGGADALANSQKGILAKDIDYFYDSATIIGSSSGYHDVEDNSVADFSVVRFAKLGLIGTGIQTNPFIVEDFTDFVYIAMFPWAAFEQIDNINMASVDYEAICDKLLETVFSGTYKGLGNSINAAKLEGSKGLIGIFPQVQYGSISDIKVIGVDMTVEYSGEMIYAGGVVGRALSGSEITDIVVSGTLTVGGDITKTKAYVGGVVGDFMGSKLENCVSTVTVKVDSSYEAVVGGVVGQISGEQAGANALTSYAKVDVNYSASGYVGNVIGYVYQTIATDPKVYNVVSNTYVNGRVSEKSVGYSETSTISADAGSYEHIKSESKIDIGEIIASLHPFESGTGTASDPFVVSDYSSLLRIADYMYASFLIAKDITIGDYDGDGLVDEDYAYDFTSLGGDAVFTGSIDGGDGVLHSIYNLTDSLFKVNAGIVKNLTLNVSYDVTTDASKPVENPRYKLHDGKDIVFGGVAKYNRAGGNIKNVTIGGEIKIDILGRNRVKVGGIVGVSEGGQIRSTICAANIEVSSYVADVGGIVGSIEGDTTIEGNSLSIGSELEFNLTVVEIHANGGLVNAGLIVGALRSESTVKIVSYPIPLYICGEEVGTDENPQYVGVNIAHVQIEING